MGLIKERGELTSGELYEEVKKSVNLSDRMVREYLRHLEELGLIEMEILDKGMKGKTRVIRLVDLN